MLQYFMYIAEVTSDWWFIVIKESTILPRNIWYKNRLQYFMHNAVQIDVSSWLRNQRFLHNLFFRVN